MERDATASDEDAKASEEEERRERAEETSAEDSGSSGGSQDDEEARRAEIAGALGATDVNAANVNEALLNIQVRERAETNLAAESAANSTAAAVGLGDVAPDILAKGIVREKVTEQEGIVIREIAEFIPTAGGAPGDGTFKNTRISEWADGRKTVHEVRVGADGRKTITDLTTDGGVLTNSTKTTMTESGWNTEVLRGGNEASDAEQAEYYDKIGLSDHAAAIRDELAGGGDAGGGGDGWASDGPLGDVIDIPDDTSPIDEGGSASDGPLPDPYDIPDTDPAPDEGGSASDGPMQTSDPGGSTSGSDTSGGGAQGEWVLQGNAETGYSRVWVPRETKPEAGSSGGTSSGGESGTGDSGGGGGTNAPPGGASGSGTGGGSTSGSGTGTGGDDSDEDDDEDDDDDADDGDDSGDGDEGSERPTDEQSGGTAPDPLGLTQPSLRAGVFIGGPDYDPNADPISGTPQVAPQGGGVTDPPQDAEGTAPDPLGLTAAAVPPRVFEGGPDYDPNADPVMGSGTPQVTPGSGGGGDPTVAMTASGTGDGGAAAAAPAQLAAAAPAAELAAAPLAAEADSVLFAVEAGAAVSGGDIDPGGPLPAGMEGPSGDEPMGPPPDGGEG